jgi:hypothetical protein
MMKKHEFAHVNMKHNIFCDGIKDIPNVVMKCNMFVTKGATRKVDPYWTSKLITNDINQPYSISIIVEPSPFWPKLNYFLFYRTFEKIFIICVKILINLKVQLLGFEMQTFHNSDFEL